jgi:alkanesulfonate monooxygenase SsuD/methylene tetrahydromethanopterin reductase-like flavin-dependent oxidoreductase (luciferase family)
MLYGKAEALVNSALSNGRLILGVGAGWMKEEFDALCLSYAERGAMA